jgi:hypothetical protein
MGPKKRSGIGRGLPAGESFKGNEVDSPTLCQKALGEPEPMR